MDTDRFPGGHWIRANMQCGHRKVVCLFKQENSEGARWSLWKRGRNPTTRHRNIDRDICRNRATIASLWSEGIIGPTDQLVQCNSMGLIGFLFFSVKRLLMLILAKRSQTSHSCFPLFDVDHLEIANCSNLTIVFYPLGNFGQALRIRSCDEDLILTKKSHNCAGIAFIEGDSARDSNLIKQTILLLQ